jgi:hypothetical protein
MQQRRFVLKMQFEERPRAFEAILCGSGSPDIAGVITEPFATMSHRDGYSRYDVTSSRL